MPVCYRCGGSGHWKAECTVPVAVKVPVADAAGAAPKWKGNPVPSRRPVEQVSKRQHEWGNYARQLLGDIPHCGDPADLYTSPLRRSMRLPSIHLCQLRQIAAAQAEESHQRERTLYERS